MDKEKGNGNTVLLTVIGVATLLVALVGATFAYFSATITSESEESIYITTATPLGLIYTGTELSMTDIIPGESVSNAFTVENPAPQAGQTGVIQTYDLELVVDTNTLTAQTNAGQLIVTVGTNGKGTTANATDASKISTMQDLVADTSRTGINSDANYGTATDIASAAGVYDFTDGKATKEESSADGNVPAGTRIKLVNDQRILVGEKQSYAVKVEFKELDKNQDENQKRSFRAHFEVRDPVSKTE